MQAPSAPPTVSAARHLHSSPRHQRPRMGSAARRMASARPEGPDAIPALTTNVAAVHEIPRSAIHAKKRLPMDSALPPVTVPVLQQMKREARKSIGVVAWDYQTTAIAERAGQIGRAHV